MGINEEFIMMKWDLKKEGISECVKYCAGCSDKKKNSEQN